VEIDEFLLLWGFEDNAVRQKRDVRHKLFFVKDYTGETEMLALIHGSILLQELIQVGIAAIEG
jgi:hypothetical protein